MAGTWVPSRPELWQHPAYLASESTALVISEDGKVDLIRGESTVGVVTAQRHDAHGATFRCRFNSARGPEDATLHLSTTEEEGLWLQLPQVGPAGPEFYKKQDMPSESTCTTMATTLATTPGLEPAIAVLVGRWLPTRAQDWFQPNLPDSDRIDHQWTEDGRGLLISGRLRFTAKLLRRLTEFQYSVKVSPEDGAEAKISKGESVGALTFLHDGTYVLESVHFGVGCINMRKDMEGEANRQMVSEVQDGAVRRWWKSLGHTASRYFGSVPEVEVGTWTRRILSAPDLLRLRQRCKAEGVTVQSALAAATALANVHVVRWAPVIMTIAQTRHDLGVSEDAIGCFVGWLVHTVTADRPFWQAAAAYQRALRSDLSEGKQLHCCDFLPDNVSVSALARGARSASRQAFHQVRQRQGFTMLSNRGACELSTPGRKVMGLYVFRKFTHVANCINVNTCSVDGVLHLSTTSGSSWCNQTILEAFAEHLCSLLKQHSG